jgi:hypothetical protein
MPTYKNIYYADGATSMISSQISYDEMSSAGDAIQDVERNIPIKVDSAIERDAKYPTPESGDAVWRTDAGVEQRYSATSPTGWYGATTGLMKVKPSNVAFGGSGTGSISDSGLITFAGVTTITVNDIFNPAFKNYKLLFNLQSTSVSGNTYLRYAVDGVADGSANYYRTNFYSNSGTVSGTYTPNNSQGALLLWQATGGRSGLSEATIYTPYLGRPVIDITTVSSGPAIAPGLLRESVYFNSTTVSFDGFNIFNTAGTMTGSMLVYGFN